MTDFGMLETVWSTFQRLRSTCAHLSLVFVDVLCSFTENILHEAGFLFYVNFVCIWRHHPKIGFRADYDEYFLLHSSRSLFNRRITNSETVWNAIWSIRKAKVIRRMCLCAPIFTFWKFLIYSFWGFFPWRSLGRGRWPHGSWKRRYNEEEKAFMDPFLYHPFWYKTRDLFRFESFSLPRVGNLEGF